MKTKISQLMAIAAMSLAAVGTTYAHEDYPRQVPFIGLAMLQKAREARRQISKQHLDTPPPKVPIEKSLWIAVPST